MNQSEITIKSTERLVGQLRVPGDKSISHRLAMLCSLVPGVSEIEGYLGSEDCLNTLKAMGSLGVDVETLGPGHLKIHGASEGLKSPDKVLDLGNSGTGMRLLTGFLAGQPIQATLTGDESLRSRPMKRIQAPLEQMQADVILHGANGCAPIEIRGRELQPITYKLPMASAQVKSAVLLAGLRAKGVTKVIEPAETRDHTERLMRALGIPIDVDGLTVSLDGARVDVSRFPARKWRVPGDFSSAAFWMTAAAMIPGAEVTLQGVGLNPRRTALLNVLRRMGADIEIAAQDDCDDWEPIGDLVIKGQNLQGTVVEGPEIPNLIDELPLVAIAAAVADGETIVKDAAELRVKESDRIAAICGNLKACGVEVVEDEGGFSVQGGGVAGGVTVDSFGDHRIAMAFAVLGLVAKAPITIESIGCIATSYPEFWRDMKLLAADALCCDVATGKHEAIAIDGPSASGKSTVARGVARHLGYLYVDSGALYRAVAWKALAENVDPSNAEALEPMTAAISMRFFVDEGAVAFEIDGESPGLALREERVNQVVSPVAANPFVREKVTGWLRRMRELGALVMEGRDIGTVVFPDATFKFYLDASPEERARRRHAEMHSQASDLSVDAVGASLQRRDQIDSRRMTAPLKTAPDAIIVDSTGMGIDDVVRWVIARVEHAVPERKP